LSKPASLRDHALRLLGRREYFRAELQARLAAVPDAAPSEVDALLDEFERRGWLSDERAALARVAGRQARLGRGRLGQELRARGADADIVSRALASVTESESDRALAILRRRYAGPPADGQDRARRARFLAARGFSEGVIRQVIDFKDESDVKQVEK